MNVFASLVILEKVHVAELERNGYSHVRVGTHGDGTPAFARIEIYPQPEPLETVSCPPPQAPQEGN
jgi:hypothetical protein